MIKWSEFPAHVDFAMTVRNYSRFTYKCRLSHNQKMDLFIYQGNKRNFPLALKEDSML